MASEYIFVYGTLLPELAPPRMANAVGQLKAIGAGAVPGRLYNLENYPGAILGGEGTICGRIFELPSEQDVLKALDDYEEFRSGQPDSSEFVRKKCHVALDDGRMLTCWIYEYNRDPGSAKLIPQGDYLRFRR